MYLRSALGTFCGPSLFCGSALLLISLRTPDLSRTAIHAAPLPELRRSPPSQRRTYRQPRASGTSGTSGTSGRTSGTTRLPLHAHLLGADGAKRCAGGAPCPLRKPFKAGFPQNCSLGCGIKIIKVGDKIVGMAGGYMHTACALHTCFPGVSREDLLPKVVRFARGAEAAARYTERIQTGRSAIVQGGPGSGKSTEMVGFSKVAGLLSVKPLTYNKNNQMCAAAAPPSPACRHSTLPMRPSSSPRCASGDVCGAQLARLQGPQQREHDSLLRHVGRARRRA